jgi:hypothetical protein
MEGIAFESHVPLDFVILEGQAGRGRRWAAVSAGPEEPKKKILSLRVRTA